MPVGRGGRIVTGGLTMAGKRKRQHILARALILKVQPAGTVVLLAQNVGKRHTFLPGGHVDPGEGLEHALVREHQEELGISIEVVAYLGAVEHQFTEGEKEHYEVNHVFLATLAEPLDEPQSQEAHLRFFWCPVSALAEHNLQPEPLQALIARHVAGARSIWWASTLPDAEAS
jgi:8-oxo-dGTP pyrophosphatase MutT (NUDIX family)